MAKDTQDITAAAYEDFQYENLAFRTTHPDWLGTVGRVFGMQPAPADGCRVLELGCGPGGNLVPMAELLPSSEFVGVDLSTSQIERARADAAAAGATNVRFEAMDILDVPDWGPFDYIICHGVFSWVPDEVQRRILAIASEQLAPQGIAYVSYNTLPGWHARGMLRAILRRVVPQGPPQQMARTARIFIQALRQRSPEQLPLGSWLRSEFELLDLLSDRYLYFEYLVEENVPLYFDEFLELATTAGLQYLGDADIASMLPAQLGEDGARFVDSATQTQVEQEQLLDYLTIRLFRRTLLCGDGVVVRREIDHLVLADGWIASDLTLDDVSDEHDRPVDLEDDPVRRRLLDDATELTFTDADGLRISSDDPFSKSLLYELARTGPEGSMTTELASAVGAQLGRPMDEGLVGDVCARAMRLLLQGRLQAGRWRRPTASQAPPRPTTTAVVRNQAGVGEQAVVGPRHEQQAVGLLDAALLAAMDGTRDVDGLASVVIEAQRQGTLSIGTGDAAGSDGPDGTADIVTDATLLRALVEERVAALAARGLILRPTASDAP